MSDTRSWENKVGWAKRPRTRVAINTSSRYAARVVALVVSFLLTPYLLSRLGRELMGLQILAYDALQFAVLASAAIGSSYARFAMVRYARDDWAGMNRILGAGLTLTASASFLLLAITIALAIFAPALLGVPRALYGPAVGVILITGFGMIAGLFLRVWEAPVFITERFYLSEIGGMVAQVAAAVGIVFLFQVVVPSVVLWVALATGVGLAVRLLLVVPLAVRSLPPMRIRPVWDLPALKQVGAFGTLAFLGGLGYLLNYVTDSLIISHIDELGPAKVITYNLGQRWDPYIRQVVAAFTHTLVPVLTACASRQEFDTIRYILLKGTRYCLLLGLYPCLMLGVFAHPFIAHWVGPEFAAESGPVLQLFMGTLLLSIPAIMAYETLFASDQLKEAAMATLLGGVVNIVLSIVLAKYAGLGIVGVALGTVVTMGLKNGIYMPWLTSRRLGVGMSRYLVHGYARGLASALPLLVVAVALRLALPTSDLSGLIAQFALCAVVYGISVWTIGLIGVERRDALSAMSKVLGWIGRKPNAS